MRLLLDTHVVIWWVEGEPLAASAVRAIREADQVFVSAVSGWEMAVKASIGRLEVTRRLEDVVAESGFDELPLRIAHTEVVRDLPWHHRDPFDRLLVAQALSESLTLVTRDRLVSRYGVRTLKG